MSPDVIVNREGLGDFDVHWPWTRGPLRRGLTAVLRVKDEARNLPWVLPPLLRAVDHVLLIDNQSTDHTADVARQAAAGAGASDRLEVTTYPFDVSRCGPEHLATPADSVHSLTHFYNWSFARVRTTYSMKWDGDMVLTDEGVDMLRQVAWQVESTESIVVFPRHPLYVESAEVGYLDAKLRNIEPWVYPMGPAYTFVKGFDWEIRDHPDDVNRLVMPEGLVAELKWLDTDEFAHWTSTDAFDAVRSPRKVRELEVVTALREGRFADLEQVHRIEAPDGVHVVDHVADCWLPRAPRPLTG